MDDLLNTNSGAFQISTAPALSQSSGFLPRASVLSQLIAACGTVILFLNLPPWTPRFVSAALDPSWEEVLQFAHRTGLRWGSEILITLGPLGFIFPRSYDPATYELSLLLWVFLTLSVGLGLAVLVRGQRAWIALCATTGTILGMNVPDTFLLGIPLVLVLAWTKPAGSLRSWALVCLVVSTALSTQVKLSAMPLCLLSVTLMDAARVISRRWPFWTAAYLGATLLVWLCCGQHLSDIPIYLSGSLDIIAGFDAAMQISGSKIEVIAFLVCAFLTASVTGWLLCRCPALRLPQKVAVAIFGLAFLELAFKAGFVRQDLHTRTSWLTLGLLGVLLLSLAWVGGAWKGRLALVLLATICFGFAGDAIHRFQNFPRSAVLYPLRPEILLQDAKEVALVIGGRRTALFDRTRQEALQQIAAGAQLPQLAGTTDMMAPHQAVLIASGADYDPRPIFQGYAAYTVALARRNRDFFEGPRAPDNVVFAIEMTDQRYPSTVDGLVWPALLGRYEPARFAGGNLLLRKRDVPQAVGFSPAVARDLAVGEVAPLWTDPSARAVFARIEFDRPLLGRLLATLWKPPVVVLLLTEESGRQHSYRLVPGNAEAGFILSPEITTEMDFLSLYLATVPNTGFDRIKDLSIQLPDWGRWVYGSRVRVVLAPITIPMLRDSRFDILANTRLIWRQLAASSPTAAIDGDTLFAHVPSDLGIACADCREAQVSFGIKDLAWQGDNHVHGVTFQIQAEDAAGNRRPIWSRTLQPATVSTDRKLQQAEIAVPSDTATLRFETIPLDGDPRWGWSYWGPIQFSRVDLAHMPGLPAR